jgi:hypothetical protein
VPREATVPRKRGLQAALRARPETPAGSAPPPRGDRHPAVICQPRRRGAHSPRVLRDGFARRAGFPRRAGGHYSEREDQFLAHRRAGEPCPRCGHTIRKIVGGTCSSRPIHGRRRGRAASGDAGGVAGAGPPVGDGGRRDRRRWRGRVGPSVRVGPGASRPGGEPGRGGAGPGGEPGRGASRAGGAVGQEERSGRKGGRAGGRVGSVGVAAGCKTCQGPSHRSRRVQISIPTMLMCTRWDRAHPPCHALHNGDHVGPADALTSAECGCFASGPA